MRQRRSGSRANADAVVHRQLRQHSLKTSWQNLADACEQLVVWRSFALWVRAIVEAEGALPQSLKETMVQRCPGFLEARSNAAVCDSIWLDLSAWIDDHFFAASREGGWIDALHYYSGRDPRSEQVWNHWIRAGEAWRGHQPKDYPTFDEWHQDALQYRHSYAGTQSEHSTEELARSAQPQDRLPALVAQYIEWEAFAFWARLIVEHESELPGDVVGVIEQRCPGFLNHIHGEQPAHVEYSTWFWRELLAWIESHIFADAKRESSIKAVSDSARTHLRGERIAEYWAACSARWRKSPPMAYPSFEQWLQNADAFVAQ
jgi:hypothetical protein